MQWSKNPGPAYASRGYNTKAEAWAKGAKESCLEHMAKMDENTLPYLSSSGGRAKLTTREKYHSKKKRGDPVGRFIRMVDVRDVAFAHVAKKALEVHNDWSTWDTALNLSYFNDGGWEYANYFHYTTDPDIFGCGLDLKRCDANFPTQLSRKILDRLLNLLPADQVTPVRRNYLYKIHCDGFVLNPSSAHIMAVRHGLCSGAPFVSLIESLGVTTMTKVAIRWHTRESSQSLADRLRIRALGDDQWFTLRGKPVGQSVLSPLYRELFGQTIGPDTPEGMGIGAYEFLGKRLTEGRYHPWRSTNETCLLLKFPERPVNSAAQSLARAIGHLVDNFCNERARAITREHIEMLYALYPGLTWTEQDLAPFLREEGMYVLLAGRIMFSGVPTDEDLMTLYFGTSVVQ
jgi:hypothetical protein